MDKNITKKDNLDRRMSQVMEIISEAPITDLNSFLDIGMGDGYILKWLSKQGKSCTGIGLEIDSYGDEVKNLKKEFGIETIEGSAESLPFTDSKFDCIIMSHVLEHCLNMEIVLKEARQVLKDNGWLFVFVPPYDSRICAGHVNTGWNIGQLMYILLLNGFNVKNGRFIEYGYNVAAFVQKDKETLPILRHDRGDIDILTKANKWPAEIISRDGVRDSFYGRIKSINWAPDSKILIKINDQFNGSVIKKNFFVMISSIVNMLPQSLRLKFANLFAILSKTFKRGLVEESNNKINPKELA